MIYRRRRTAVVLALVVLALVVIFIWPGFARSAAPSAAPATKSPAASSASSATASPTATSSATASRSASAKPSSAATTAPAKPVAVARPTGSPFAQVLPARVGQRVLTAQSSPETWYEDGAVEEFLLTYSGTAMSAVTVHAGNWPDALSAAKAAEAFAAKAGTSTSTGEVEAGGKSAGTYWVIPTGGADSTVIWSNNTAVLQATGSSAAVVAFYRAYPL